jgi:hypothetical protein
VAYQSGLLLYPAPTIEDHEIWNAQNIETGGELRVFFGIDLQDDGPARHFRGSLRDFGSGHAARPAPVRPEIHEDGNRGILDDFIERHIVHRHGFSEWRQRRFARSAAARAGQMFAWNAVLPCATAADADNGHKASANIDNPKGWGRQPDPPHNTATSGIFEIRSFTLQF